MKTKDNILTDYFKNIIFLSGTPAAFQRELSKTWSKNVCSCSPKDAMENNWICKPTLNLVKGNTDTDWSRAIVAVLNREKAICKKEVFKTRLMVNCGSIDAIKQLVELNWMLEHVGKDFHFITLHSNKGYDDGDGNKAIVQPTIDCKNVAADEAYKAIEAIDTNSYFNDDLPIIVAQVAMLGEGINVSSFNSILTASNSEKTAMQQIGRCIRNYKVNDKEKVYHGHANVYVLNDNIVSIKQLLLNLEEYDLTDECFSWGDKIDISTGSGDNENDNESISELNDFKWEPIDPNYDLDIIEMMQSMKTKLFKNRAAEIFNEFIHDNDIDGKADIEELEDLLDKLTKQGITKLWSKSSFSKSEMVKNRKAYEKAKKNLSSNAKVREVKKIKEKISPMHDMFMKWLFEIRHSIKTSDISKILWKKNRVLCIENILQNHDIAKFLAKHLNKKIIRMICD